VICELWDCELAPGNLSGICAECRLIVSNRLGARIEERWAPAVGLDGVIVSNRPALALSAGDHAGINAVMIEVVCSGRAMPVLAALAQQALELAPPGTGKTRRSLAQSAVLWVSL
jgi:hypothetical protein